MAYQNDRNEGAILREKEISQTIEKRMTDRDKKIIKILQKHKFASRDHLIQLLDMQNLKQATAILNKRLKFLYDHHFIDRVCTYDRPGSASLPYVYSLDRASKYIVGKKNWKRSIKHIKGVDGKIIKRLPITYMHNLVINDVVCIAKQTAEDIGWTLTYMGVEEENFIPITYKKKSGIVPDIVLVMMDQKSEILLSFFIEVDLGNEGKGLLKSKAGHYNMLKLCRTWIDTNWYKEHVMEYVAPSVLFPHIVFLMGNSNSARNKMMRDALQQWDLHSTVISLSDFRKWIKNQMR